MELKMAFLRKLKKEILVGFLLTNTVELIFFFLLNFLILFKKGEDEDKITSLEEKMDGMEKKMDTIISLIKNVEEKITVKEKFENMKINDLFLLKNSVEKKD